MAACASVLCPQSLRLLLFPLTSSLFPLTMQYHATCRTSHMVANGLALRDENLLTQRAGYSSPHAVPFIIDPREHLIPDLT